MTQNSLYTIGLTGLTGGGKTTVSRLLKERGGFVVVTDAIAHEVILRGRPAYAAVAEAFGAGILDEQGEIDRRRLGEIVFGQARQMRVLEAIVHPYIKAEALRRIRQAAQRQQQYPFAVIDAPLLVEAGMHTLCDRVWLVTADEATRKARIMARDGLTEPQAAARLQSRPSEDALRPYAHTILYNDGDEAALTRAVHKSLEGLDLCEKK